MAASLEIRESQSGIFARVTASRRIGRALIISAFGIVFTFFLLRSDATSTQALATTLVVMIVVLGGIVSALRGTAVELRVTEVEFISSGHAPEDYVPSVIPRADIYDLEFREASGGGDFPELPMGLYVKHHGGILTNPSTCVLPHTDKAQTEEVIKAIYRRFPDTGKLPSIGGFEPYLTSLNLNAMNRE